MLFVYVAHFSCYLNASQSSLDCNALNTEMQSAHQIDFLQPYLQDLALKSLSILVEGITV